ncbi:MAG: SWIM zinc finger family protein, partial [Rhizobiales bacterium]|nr:SWIM zinc finger family protein [Hyphomicrobiales bacterium]
ATIFSESALMPLTIDKIESMAPDQASLAAAAKIKPSAWPLRAQNVGVNLAWGECQGSGSTAYRVALALDDLGYKCTCPSRKFPCKHSLGLMLLYARAAESFFESPVPDWVNDWTARRRPTSTVPKPEAAAKPRASLDDIVAEAASEPDDEKAKARAAQQRERLKAQREESILRGLDELDLWIEDRLNRGIAGFMNDAAQQCRISAQRLVDAKAPGIATRIDSLPSELLALPERVRADAVIDALGSLHLLAEAYRRQDKLPEALRHDVRRLVGWTQERQALLEDTSAPRVTSTWSVIATHSEIQPDKLRRIETWLAGQHEGTPIYATLIDFVPVGTGAGGSPFLAGEVFSAELVYYPSAAPLRALIANRIEAKETEDQPAALTGLAQSLDAYDELRTRQPWLGQWPIRFSGAAVLDYGSQGLWVVDGDHGMPLHPRQQDDALVLADVTISELTGLWDGRYFMAAMAETSLGRWFRQ